MDGRVRRFGFFGLLAGAAVLLGASGAANDTLRLNSAHPFDVRLTARDQRTGNTAAGQALPQNDIFGYFSLPGLTGDPKNPEVFVKLLDGTGINGQFWVFYGHLTDLEYTLEVTEVATGRKKTYHKNPGNEAGGFDTSGFNFTPTPSGGSPTPTPTPPPGSVTITIQVTRYSYAPGTSSPIDVTAGQSTTLFFQSSDTRHGFSGISALGVPGSDDIHPEIPPGDDGYGYTTPGSPEKTYSVTFTPPLSARGQTFAFSCSAPGTGCGAGHATMQGTLRVN